MFVLTVTATTVVWINGDLAESNIYKLLKANEIDWTMPDNFFRHFESSLFTSMLLNLHILTFSLLRKACPNHHPHKHTLHHSGLTCSSTRTGLTTEDSFSTFLSLPLNIKIG